MIKYVHTNIIAQDWRKLADFYIQTFDCRLKPPQRNLSGDWLSDAVGVAQAAKQPSVSNRTGFRHIAFLVDDVSAMLDKVVAHGGSRLGQVVEKQINGVGWLTFTYAYDPEGNIIELQSWRSDA